MTGSTEGLFCGGGGPSDSGRLGSARMIRGLGTFKVAPTKAIARERSESGTREHSTSKRGTCPATLPRVHAADQTLEQFRGRTLAVSGPSIRSLGELGHEGGRV